MLIIVCTIALLVSVIYCKTNNKINNPKQVDEKNLVQWIKEPLSGDEDERVCLGKILEVIPIPTGGIFGGCGSQIKTEKMTVLVPTSRSILLGQNAYLTKRKLLYSTYFYLKIDSSSHEILLNINHEED